MKRRSNSWSSIHDATLFETVEGELEKRQRKWRELITGDEDKRIRDTPLHEIKSQLKKRTTHGVKEFKKRTEKLERNAKKTIQKISTTVETKRKRPSDRRELDKLGFTAGVAALFFCQYVLLVHPQHFYLLYLAVLPTLMVLKLGYYKTLGMFM